jgi:hypothetical protein
MGDRGGSSWVDLRIPNHVFQPYFPYFYKQKNHVTALFVFVTFETFDYRVDAV